ncbi:uncharacterized protein LOC114673426 [Macaca mulatta]
MFCGPCNYLTWTSRLLFSSLHTPGLNTSTPQTPLLQQDSPGSQAFQLRLDYTTSSFPDSSVYRWHVVGLSGFHYHAHASCEADYMRLCGSGVAQRSGLPDMKYCLCREWD